MYKRRDRIRRYRQIIAVFTENGFGLLLDQLGVLKYLKVRKSISSDGSTTDSSRSSLGKRLRLSFETLGPTFVKVGQVLSTRPDIIPSDIVDELKKLQDFVQSFPFPDAKAVIEEEFGDTLKNIFTEFEETPVAAASLSQVHRARLFSGKMVAVKVQRPNIEKNIELDFNILKDLAGFLDNHTNYGKLYNFSGMVTEFESTIKNELDFTKEAEHADTFRKNFAKDEGIRVPDIKWIYTSKRVLTMEFIEGIRIDDFSALDEAGIDKTKLANRLATSMCYQILKDGFYHADPHPGNIRVMPDSTIIFLDLGMVGILDESMKRMITNLFIGAAQRDSKLVVKSIVGMDAITNRSNIKKFEKTVDSILDKYLTMPLNEIKLADMLYEVFKIAFVNKIKIPREFALLAKTLGTAQNLLEELDPDLNALIVAKPIAKKLLIQSISPGEIGKEIKKSLWSYGDLIKEFPSAFLNFLYKLEDEDFTFQLEIKEFDKIQRRFVNSFNRMSFSVVLLAVSIIIAGIIIGSSLSAGTGSEMYMLNITILKAGLVIALLIVVGMIISVFKSRR